MFYQSPARIVECVSEYIFLISRNKEEKKKKKKLQKKTKEEKRMSPENLLKKILQLPR